jgi:hypothetical protein
MHGWGDRSARIIELEPEGSCSLIVDPIFKDVGRGNETLLISEWSQHVHLRALDPFSDVDEYRWADRIRGFKFIGLSRGKYLLETTEYFTIDGEKRQRGPWSGVIDLSDPARDHFEFKDVIPTYSFDCVVRNDGPPRTEIARCNVWPANSDPQWDQRRKSLKLEPDGTLHVLDITAGRWIISGYGITEFGWVGFSGEFSVSAAGIATELTLANSETRAPETSYWRSGLYIHEGSPSFGESSTDGWLILHSLGGTPLKSWVTGPRFTVSVEGIPAGYYWFSFLSAERTWHSVARFVERGERSSIYRHADARIVQLGLTLKNITYADAKGAYLENEVGYQPACMLYEHFDDVMLWAEQVPCFRKVYLCLGDGRRIALNSLNTPSDNLARSITLDLKTR